MRLLGVEDPTFPELFPVSQDKMKASYPELESDWARIRLGTLDAHDATVIHEDQSSYKVKAVDSGSSKTAVVENA
jgi:hypothetical protein